MINAKKWVLIFLSLTLAILIGLAAIAYIIDPFFQFRVRDNTYKLSSWFVSSGLIENYDYDTLIIGSSMTQNFTMDVVREELGVHPLKIGIGGIRPSEMEALLNLAYEEHKANDYIICVDLTFFTQDDEGNRYPKYLLKKDFLSRMQYFLSYDTWFRYIPVDIAFISLENAGVNLPEKIAKSTSIDWLDDYRMDVTYSEENALSDYRRIKSQPIEPPSSRLYEEMCARIDGFLNGFDFAAGNHTFFFPPYSSLFWCDTQEKGQLETYLRAKEYFVEKASKYGASVYDFQAADCTMILDNYMDISHYSPEINDWIIKCFANGEFRVQPENYYETLDKLIGNTKNLMRDLECSAF